MRQKQYLKRLYLEFLKIDKPTDSRISENPNKDTFNKNHTQTYQDCTDKNQRQKNKILKAGWRAKGTLQPKEQ